jgi:hypothetical protein
MIFHQIEARTGATSTAVIMNDDSGGYISPVFALSSDEESRPVKRRKHDRGDGFPVSNLHEDEELALALLGRGG